MSTFHNPVYTVLEKYSSVQRWHGILASVSANSLEKHICHTITHKIAS